MSGQNKSPEIVTEKDLEPVLKNNSFDAATFLRLYNEWKVTHETSIFAALRTMHEKAGYNNKNNIFGAEKEMHEIAAIVQRFHDGRLQIHQGTAAAGHAVVGAAPAIVAQTTGVVEIREKLTEINPTTLEQAIVLSESIINTLPNSDMKTTLRGVHGAIIFDILRSAGHNVIIKNGQVEIQPKPGSDVVNLQEKLQTLVNTGKLPIESLKLGMLYSSPNFKNYVEMKKTTDGKIDRTASPQDFMKYLQDLKASGKTDGDIETILKSQGMLTGVNMQQAIRGFQDLGQVGTWIQANQGTVAQSVQAWVVSSPATSQALVQSPTAQVPSAPTPSTPSNLLTGGIANGVTGGKITGVIGDSFKGLLGGIGDIFKMANGDPLAQVGIGVGLIYGVYKLFQKVGFLGGVGTLLGAGAINAFKDIEKRLGIQGILNPASPAQTPTPPAAPAPVAAPAPAPSNSIDTSKLSPAQKKAYDKCKDDADIKKRIENNAKSNPKENGDMDAYMKFIFSPEMQGQKLENLIYTRDPDRDVFHNEKKHALAMKKPEALNIIILKRCMRLMLIGDQNLTAPIAPAKEGDKEKADFISKYPSTTWQGKTLSDITNEIHK